jgi:nicotinamide N-methyltransferase
MAAAYRWNTSKVLSTFLLRNPAVFRGKRILELGAGAGLPVLVAGVSGAERVVITDYPDEQLVDNIRWNVGCNVQQGEQPHVLVDVSGPHSCET